ncbi:hypothetical protein Btru_062809 [Bulinus truncatus]|nr:hypothetical protein Btru_062809 [Bulinus truncatus]
MNFELLRLKKETEVPDQITTIGVESAPPVDCENQARHKEYIDINSFQKENLPPCYQHDEMLHLVKSLADLTVKIKVKNAHEQFKQFWKIEHENSFLSRYGSWDTLFGSGKVDEVFYRTERDGSCECLECKEVPKDKWGEVRILTSAQLAYDDEDATHFKCTLFYDDDSEKDRTTFLTGSKVVVFNAMNDMCVCLFVKLVT